MSEFTKVSPHQQLSGTADPRERPMDEIAFYVRRGKQLHSKAVREALMAGFCSIGKLADRIGAAIAQTVRKAGHSPS